MSWGSLHEMLESGLQALDGWLEVDIIVRVGPQPPFTRDFDVAHSVESVFEIGSDELTSSLFFLQPHRQRKTRPWGLIPAHLSLKIANLSRPRGVNIPSLRLSRMSLLA